MSATIRSRPKSTSSAASSLMQDVPGAFPAPPGIGADVEEENEQEELVHRTLPQIVHARRAEYVRPKQLRIKVGTWNVAAYKGAENDVGGWFVGGRGVSASLSGLKVSEPGSDGETILEDAGEQEAHYKSRESTLPIHDTSVLPSDDQVGLYVLGLQEVVDVSSATEALRPYTDPGVARRWKEAMQSALPTGYQLVAEQQLIGLLLLIYAAPDVAKDIKSVSTTSVGTGLMGYMGNKGAVTARFVLGETTRLVFVNCHLAAGADKTALERRNWDAQQIVSRTRFEPIKDAMDLQQTTGEQIGEEDFAFWCGDLNYRLEGIPGDDVRRLLMLHTRNEYDLSQASAHKIDKEISEATRSVKDRVGDENSAGSSLSAMQSLESRQSTEKSRPTTLIDDIEASEDPASLQTTLSSLLPHDELQQQIQARKAFHDGWREGPITFLPTYKYDAGTVGVFDSSEKKRAPSWCDRILYRTRRDKLAFEATIREEENARKKDEELQANGTAQAASDEDILYDYDPETDGADTFGHDEYDENDDGDDGTVVTKEGFEDSIVLEHYLAHQRVLSSDHKPLNACFMLNYDAVVPDLKAKVHAEVARELDKEENEGRPNVVVVVDKHNNVAGTTDECVPEKFEGVWFGDVRWMQSKHRSLTVANTSRVPATFTLIERPVQDSQQAGLAPKWLGIKINGQEVKSSADQSESVTLEPGETGNVELELRITAVDDVRDLNSENRDLEDILVLRVENGRDHFIPLRGHWMASSLARSIDKLIRIPEGGIRKLQGQKPQGESKIKNAVSAMAAANVFSGKETSSQTSLEHPTSSDTSMSLQKSLSNSSSASREYPVRFSAPRELFKLTEAVEELSTRVVAEWDMINAPSTPVNSIDATSAVTSAPWDEHPAWPFDESLWDKQDTEYWQSALSVTCNALDEDEPIENAIPADITKIQRLYVLSSLLVTFLRSITDGIITQDLWARVDGYIADNEKLKRKLSNDDQRTGIQEILSQSPSHNISFILVTSMLERMVQERMSSETIPSTVGGHNRTTSRDTVDMPMSPTKRAGGALKRMVTGKGSTPTVNQAARKRDEAVKALAKVFAPAMIRIIPVTNDKARTAAEKRAVEVVEVFLKRDEPG